MGVAVMSSVRVNSEICGTAAVGDHSIIRDSLEAVNVLVSALDAVLIQQWQPVELDRP